MESLDLIDNEGTLTMMTKKYALTLIAEILVVSLTNFGVFIAPAISYESVEQEREICIQDCKSRYGYTLNRRGGGTPDNYWRYAKCLVTCEKKFWKEWQKREDETGKD